MEFLLWVAGFLLLVPGVLWEGLVIKILWGWFMVPTLHAPPIGITAAIGLSVLLSVVSYNYHGEDPDISWIYGSLAASVVNSGIMLLVGFIASRFM